MTPPRSRRGAPSLPSPQAGLTVIEMLIVVTIIGLMAGLTFPSVSSGLDSMRLRSAADSVAVFLTQALTRVERSQEPVEIAFLKAEGRLELRAPNPAFNRTLQLPNGLSILHVHPEHHAEGETVRTVFLLPGATVPRFGVEIINQRGSRRLIRLDPLAAVPIVEIPPERVSGEER